MIESGPKSSLAPTSAVKLLLLLLLVLGVVSTTRGSGERLHLLCLKCVNVVVFSLQTKVGFLCDKYI